MPAKFYFLILICFPAILCQIDYHQTLQSIAKDFGSRMRNIGYEKTCFERIQGNFQKHRSEVKQIDGSRLMDQMRQDLKAMFKWKRDAVERIANETENLAKKYAYPVKKMDGQVVDYHNVKRIYDDREEQPPAKNDMVYRPLSLSAHPNFEDAKVNLRHSAVHVPINVYEQANEMQHDINWTEPLTETFTKNLHEDPSLSWQFFCSHKGFLREYPASKWRLDSHSKMPDLYDCRMRQWYIQAAASPKDLVVLLDVSGSMTGLRKNIAQNVVFNILDTLTEDDFVLVLQFTNEIKFVSPCFDRLVQATKQNVREIKTQLEGFKTSDIANFTLALIQAFQTLKNFSAENRGAMCNQAVMLITDGAPETYESVFQKYNPDGEIRVFTYVIGREVTQVQEVYWMACNNRGFYAQVANLAEVREQVQHYIPVMSRPLVLHAQRIFAWTPVYAPVSEILLTDWIWDERVKEVKMKILKQLQRQCELLKRQQDLMDEPNGGLKEADPNGTSTTYEVAEEDLSLAPVVNGEGDEGTTDEYLFRLNFRRLNIELEMAQVPEKKKRIPLMITLATPVFNHRKYINITKKILVKNVYKDSPPEEIRIAQLHGVAGIDVPIREIEKTASSYQLGVNGYSFMLTNNGKVLYHPDFRPIFQDMLKPYYTSIDITELEISNSTEKQRWIDPLIETVRNEMIDGTMSSRRIAIKAHLDHMKRPVSKIQHYFYGKIDETPFSFAVVLPDPYGSYRFKGQIDIEKTDTKHENFTRYFNSSNWKIHPDWIYCEGPHKLSGIVPKTPEDAILQFLNFDLAEKSFVWKTKSNKPQRFENATCDKELLQSLLYDAKATYLFEECSELSFKKQKEETDTKSSIDIVSVFVSTRSGLTRFSTVYGPGKTAPENGGRRNRKNRDEHRDNSIFLRSIDEIYYRRAVDYYYHDSKAFVYSIPFEAGIKKPNEFLVTASHAIFVGQGKASTPVAVVGVQYNYTSFASIFFQISERYKVNCQADEIDCLILDNNAFIMVSSETDNHAGLSLSDIDHDLLQDMVRNGIYRKILFFDYQAICIRIIPFSNSAPGRALSVLWHHLGQLLGWFVTRFFGYLSLFGQYHHANDMDLDTDMDMGMDDDCDIKFNKSTPRPCDKEFELYELQSFPGNQSTHQFSYACETSDCARTYYVQAIPHTNLVLVALLNTCYCSLNSVRFEPRECVLSKNETCELIRKESFRKRPEYCFKQHEQEKEIKFCGRSATLDRFSLLVMILFVGLVHRIFCY